MRNLARTIQMLILAIVAASCATEPPNTPSFDTEENCQTEEQQLTNSSCDALEFGDKVKTSASRNADAGDGDTEGDSGADTGDDDGGESEGDEGGESEGDGDSGAGADTGTDSGTDTGTSTGTDTGTSTGTGTGTDTGGTTTGGSTDGGTPPARPSCTLTGARSRSHEGIRCPSSSWLLADRQIVPSLMALV